MQFWCSKLLINWLYIILLYIDIPTVHVHWPESCHITDFPDGSLCTQSLYDALIQGLTPQEGIIWSPPSTQYIKMHYVSLIFLFKIMDITYFTYNLCSNSGNLNYIYVYDNLYEGHYLNKLLLYSYYRPTFLFLEKKQYKKKKNK